MLHENSTGLRHSARVALLVVAAILGSEGTATAGMWNPGDLITFSSGNWGGDPTNQTGAALVVDKFDTVYAAGVVVVGSPSSFTMAFTDAPSVLAYEPSSGPYAPLNSSVLNPLTTASGSFGGDVLALQFNVDFSDAGFLMGTSGLRFGDLVLTGFPVFLPFAPLDGLTVRQFLGDMNTLLGGGSNIVSISELGTVVGDLNASFFGGTPSPFAQDHLVAPSAPVSSVPEPSSWVLFGSGLLSLGATRRRRMYVA
jgi:hypothetical protein